MENLSSRELVTLLWVLSFLIFQGAYNIDRELGEAEQSVLLEGKMRPGVPRVYHSYKKVICMNLAFLPIVI